MKKAIGPLLIFLGVVLLTVSVAIPTILVPKLKSVPLDLDITTVAESVPAGLTDDDALPAMVFDRCSINDSHLRVYAAHLTQQRRTVVVEPSDSDRATLQSGQSLLIDRIQDGDRIVDLPVAGHNESRSCDDGLLSATVDVVSVDRSTSKPTGDMHRLHTVPGTDGVGTSESSNNWIDAPRRGYQYHFGFTIGQGKTYPYYDANSRRDLPADYVGETMIDGIKAYEFVSEVPEFDQTKLATPTGFPPLGSSVEMPARWWGIDGPGVEPGDMVLMHRFGSATRRVWVEAQTGTVLFGEERQRQFFKSPDSANPAVPQPIREFQVDAFSATMAWTEDTVAQQSDVTRGYLNQLHLGKVTVPIICGVGGTVLLACGVLVLLRSKRRDVATAEAPTPGQKL